MGLIPSGGSTNVNIIDLHGLYFEIHGIEPFLRVGPLHSTHIGDQILIIFIKINRITISDQETIVSIRLTGYFTRSPQDASAMGSGFNLIKFDSIFLLVYIGSSTYQTSSSSTLVVSVSFPRNFFSKKNILLWINNFVLQQG